MTGLPTSEDRHISDIGQSFEGAEPVGVKAPDDARQEAPEEPREKAYKKATAKLSEKARGPHYLDHRARLRARFVDGGTDAMPDYELMELVLFAAIPRRDVKPLAKTLIDKFGSFADAIAAPRERLREVTGVGDNVVTHLKIVEAAALRLSKLRVLGKPALSSWSALIDYCAAVMGRNPQEEFRILFLDRKNVLIADEVQGQGTVDHTPVYPREIVKRALELSASSIILVHNHPSGDPSPSQADIVMTREIVSAAKALRITVHDHLIVGRGGTISFKSLGLL
jgi:DNA repair protein RadC